MLFFLFPWGFSSATNTIVGNLMGQANYSSILPSMRKTAVTCFVMTMSVALPIILWPETFLYPLLGSSDMTLITDSKSTLYVLLIIVAFSSVISIYVNGIAGVRHADRSFNTNIECDILPNRNLYCGRRLAKYLKLCLEHRNNILDRTISRSFVVLP
ncbi:MAG: hypothetical protein IPO33_03075 [Saprospiraceae bacterium]|nr:hypothetical protein [Candidatus Brachybacter algidus]